MIGLSELLSARGYVPDAKRVKLVRHKDSRVDLEALRSAGWFDTYQKFQARPVFDGCEQIVAFLGEEGFNCRFVGVYDVGARTPASESVLPLGCPHPEWAQAGKFYYALEKRGGFEDLEDRLVIDWGKAALAWHQWFADRTVVEIRPPGRVLPPFRDYLRVHLSFDDLVRLAKRPDAHRDWVAGLSAVGAIYLIVDSLSGEQYVGSATGNGGLWQRWCEYARTGHGHNLRLKKRCDQDLGYPAAFRFSILETFSRSLSRDEALSLEAFFKQKLGTRAYGLNAELIDASASGVGGILPRSRMVDELTRAVDQVVRSVDPAEFAFLALTSKIELPFQIAWRARSRPLPNLAANGLHGNGGGAILLGSATRGLDPREEDQSLLHVRPHCSPRYVLSIPAIRSGEGPIFSGLRTSVFLRPPCDTRQGADSRDGVRHHQIRSRHQLGDFPVWWRRRCPHASRRCSPEQARRLFLHGIVLP